MSILEGFGRKHDFLICVDSDGCVMDTMNGKHFHCFGPCLVSQWGLEQWRDAILERWNRVNLFRMTRGINRFKGLALVLTEVDALYTPIAGLDELNRWVSGAEALSNREIMKAVEVAPEGDGKICLKKALAWSEDVNRYIEMMPALLKAAFPGVKDALEAARVFADVAIVSSANREAVEEEWDRQGLRKFGDILLAQDVGSKAYCIGQMLKYGYPKENVLMVGDAPGDCEAAEKNGVLFYPIIVNREEESWREFQEIALGRLTGNTYAGAYQQQKKREFMENLGG